MCVSAICSVMLNRKSLDLIKSFCQRNYRVMNIAMNTQKDPSEFQLKILHKSENFLVVDKNYDLVMNDDDPDRFSLAKLLKRELPDLYNENYAVSSIYGLV